MSSLSFESLYGSMIAGSVPVHAGDVEQSVAYAAADALETRAVHYHYFRAKDAPKAYYFAVPSKALASHPGARTPLTAAIPGAPEHRGDGAYLIADGSLAAVAISADGDLRLLMNTRDVIDRHLNEIGIPVHDVSHSVGGELSSSLSRGRRASDQLAGIASKASIFVLGVTVFSAFLLSLANGYLTAKVEDGYRERSQALAKVVEELNFSSPLSQQVYRLHGLAAVAIQGKGWLEKFEYRSGVTSYELGVQRSARIEAMKRLGVGHQAEERGDFVVISYSDSKPAATAVTKAASAAEPGASAPGGRPTKVAQLTAQKEKSK